MTTINPSVLASADHLRDMAAQSVDNKPIHLDNEKLAAIADLDSHDSGPTYAFTTKDGVTHHLSVTDFDAAAETLSALPGAKAFFANLTLGIDKQTGNGKIEVLSGMADVLTSSGISGGFGSVPQGGAKIPDQAANGTLKVRVIQVTDGDPIKVYGTVSPKAEALIADGWLSDQDMHELRAGNSGYQYASTNGDAGKFDAVKTMSLLYGRQVDGKGTVFQGKYDGQGSFSADDKKAQQLTFQALIQSGHANAFVSGHEGSGVKGKFEVRPIDWQAKMPVVAAAKGGASVQPPSAHLYHARKELARIDQAPNLAPDDKAYLKQLVMLKYVADFPSDNDPQRPRPGDMADLPALADVNDALPSVLAEVNKGRTASDLGPLPPASLKTMLQHPDKYAVVLAELATTLGLPTSK